MAVRPVDAALDLQGSTTLNNISSSLHTVSENPHSSVCFACTSRRGPSLNAAVGTTTPVFKLNCHSPMRVHACVWMWFYLWLRGVEQDLIENNVLTLFSMRPAPDINLIVVVSSSFVG